MAQEVTLPQLGESVTEGIITAWLVEVGDEVSADQPLVEISTDKVDTEVPSPVGGVVKELKASVDDTIEVGQVIAVIGDADESAGDGEAAAEAEEDEAPSEEEATEAATAADAPEETEQAAQAGTGGRDRDESKPQPAAASAATPAQPKTSTGNGQADGGAGTKALVSPLVRKMLREAGISPDQVQGTGQGGRITRADAEKAIEQGPAAPAEQPAPAAARPAAPPPPAPATAPAAGPSERPEASPVHIDFGGDREVTQDLSRVRKAIAKAMHRSLQETAQLTAAVEVDVTRIMNTRAAYKDQFKAQEGVSLSPLPFFARAVCMTIPRHPAVNASIDLEGGTAVYHRYINLGMAVDTDRGLLVPNIKDAQDLTIPGLARRIADIAGKTRSGKGLSPDDIQGGTFTITNTGSRGTLFDTPILNPPEVAILATCAIEKRPVVVSDAWGESIAIRWMTYLCLSYDHRMIDGADAARFLQDLKWVCENHDFAPELGGG